MKPEEAEQYLSGSVGIHANVGETSAVLAINADLCDMGQARDYWLSLSYGPSSSPSSTRSSCRLPGHSGRCWRTAAASGSKPSESTPRKARTSSPGGRRAVVNLVRDADDVHDQLEPRYSRPGARVAMPFADVEGYQVYVEAHARATPSSSSPASAPTRPHGPPDRVSPAVLPRHPPRQPGVGQTTGPGGPYSSELFADVVAAAARSLGVERAHVVGASMGGIIAQQLALRHPSSSARCRSTAPGAAPTGT